MSCQLQCFQCRGNGIAVEIIFLACEFFGGMPPGGFELYAARRNLLTDAPSGHVTTDIAEQRCNGRISKQLFRNLILHSLFCEIDNINALTQAKPCKRSLHLPDMSAGRRLASAIKTVEHKEEMLRILVRRNSPGSQRQADHLEEEFGRSIG